MRRESHRVGDPGSDRAGHPTQPARLLAQAREILLEHDGDITPGYLARKLKIGLQKASRIHQTLVADEAAAYLVTPEGTARE